MQAYHLDKDLNELTEFAQHLHANERKITMQSIHVVGELEQRRASFALGLSHEKFAKLIGLTINKYRTRVAAWRTIIFFPRAKELFENGEIDVSHLSMIAGKITQANEDVLLEGLRGTSKREAAEFIRRVRNDGTVLDEVEIVEFTVRMTADERKEFERAREILAHSGHVPSNAEIILAATRDLLNKRDPLKKAERAAARSGKKKAEAQTGLTEIFPREKSVSSNEVSADRPVEADRKRTAIPAAVRQQVWIRDEGKCTFEHQDGTRCNERMMIEVDHIKMVCRGGDNVPGNLQLRCRFHNQRQAEAELGRPLHEGTALGWWKKSQANA